MTTEIDVLMYDEAASQMAVKEPKPTSSQMIDLWLALRHLAGLSHITTALTGAARCTNHHPTRHRCLRVQRIVIWRREPSGM